MIVLVTAKISIYLLQNNGHCLSIGMQTFVLIKNKIAV